MDAFALPADGARDGIQPRAVAVRADRAFFIWVRRHVAVKGFTLLDRVADALRDDAVAHAGGADADVRVVGEEPRVEFGEAPRAFRTGVRRRIVVGAPGRGIPNGERLEARGDKASSTFP